MTAREIHLAEEEQTPACGSQISLQNYARHLAESIGLPPAAAAASSTSPFLLLSPSLVSCRLPCGHSAIGRSGFLPG